MVALFRISVFIFLLLPLSALAQVVHQELQETVRAEVIAVEPGREITVAGGDVVTIVEQVEIMVLEGARVGTRAQFDNDLITLAVGDQIFVNRLVSIDGVEYYTFKDVDRRASLLWIGLIFIVLLTWFAGKQGLRALVSLGLSIGAILFVLVPALLAGYNPAVVSLGVAGVILALVLFITHGINPRSVIAFGGTFAAVLVTCIIAMLWVAMMRLTGFGSDASIYLNFSTSGQLDFAGLLLGSIIIGILGVLDDVSITQASVVQELRAANRTFGIFELYQRAIRVGRDHVGSLVNTLALAYVGVSLPLVLLFARTDASLMSILNQEVVAAELLRIIVGSIGLILAVPLTTLLAAWWFGARDVDESDLSSHSHCGHYH